MAGHSHAKNVARRKEAQGRKKSGLFGKIARGITVAAKSGSPDPAMNPRLRLAIDKAKSVSMPNDRIKRAIEQGIPGAADGKDYQEARYEGYGPGGVAIVVECLTDNVTRTVNDIRPTFAKYGGTLGTAGSVSFMFEKLGEIVYPASKGSADAMFEAAVEAGAQNVESDDEYHSIYTDTTDLAAVSEALDKKFGAPEKSGMVWKPLNMHSVTDAETAASVMKLIDVLDENDDVQEVFYNMDVSDDIAAKLAAE